MNAPAEFFQQLQRAVCRTIAREVRTLALTLPREVVKPVGPHDADAEQAVLSALLNGHATVAELRPLAPRHFYSLFNAKVFEALTARTTRDGRCKRCDGTGRLAAFNVRPGCHYVLCNECLITSDRELQALVDLLEVRGPVLEDLTIIRDTTPFTHPSFLRQNVTTIMRRWLERELIRTMQEIDAELRVGALTHDGARRRLREHFLENSG